MRLSTLPFFYPIAGETRLDARVASEGPALRYREGSWQQNGPLTVGRGPVPRHAAVYRTVAGETRSDARVASEPPAIRYWEGFFTFAGDRLF